jgi:4a-hydroxytetrahydrobiopterin dehydratase
MKKLNAVQIKSALAKIPGWKKKAAVIAREFQFKDFPAAIKFLNATAKIAEKAQHHPDIDIRWNKVTLTLTTYDAGGLTEKDFALARQFDQISRLEIIFSGEPPQEPLMAECRLAGCAGCGQARFQHRCISIPIVEYRANRRSRHE